MKLRKVLFSSVLLVSLVTLASLVAAQKADELKLVEPEGGSTVIPESETNTADDGAAATRLFDMIWSPVRSVMRRLGKLFGSDMGKVEDRIKDARERAFKLFMRIHNKHYSVEEIPRRMALFFKRMELIEQSAKLYKEGREKFVLKPNRFLDWDDDEIKKLSSTFRPKEEQEPGSEDAKVRGSRSIASYDAGSSKQAALGASIPKNVDWRQSGCVADPIDQGTCGSCYAVASLGAIESTRCIKTRSSAILSPQHIVDCVKSYRYNSNGCDGGWPTSVFKYLQDTRTAVRDACYPYANKEQRCNLWRATQSSTSCTLNPALRSSSPIQFKVLNNEQDILYHVAKTGPVASVIQTTQKLLYYGGGIFSDRSCRNGSNDIDHALLIVGYGTDNGVDYWLIKNSWGQGWGEKGYLRIKRGYMCSVARHGWVMTG